MQMPTQKKKKMSMKSWVALGAVGVGAYLLYRQFAEEPAPVVAQPGGMPAPTDSMLPGTLAPAASGMVQQQVLPTAVQPTSLTTTDVVPPLTMPAQNVAPQQYPYAVAQPTPTPASAPTVPSGAMTAEQYLAVLGNPKRGTTVTGPLPPPGLFEPYPEGKAKGPKQRKCLRKGGAWTGPMGKKFCVMPG